MASRPSPNAEYSDAPQLTLHPSPADAPAARSAPPDCSPAPADGAPTSLLDPGALLDPKPLLDHYLAIREIVSRAQDGATALLTTGDLDDCANKLDLFRGAPFLGMEDPRMPVVLDFAIYDHVRAGRTALQRYWQTHRPKAGSLDETVRDAMFDTAYSLFRVLKVRPGVGVAVKALLGDKSRLLVDVNLSHCAVPDFVFAARLLPFDGFVISSGAALAPSPGVIDDILRQADRLAGCIGHMTSEAVRREVHAGLVRACFRNPSPVAFTHVSPEASQEEFERINQARQSELGAFGPSPARRPSGGIGVLLSGRHDPPTPAAAPLDSARRIGRNEPCPCGSGRKYKKCCGGAAS